jgi:D-alanyl-D-alanine carboxypeptidase
MSPSNLNPFLVRIHRELGIPDDYEQRTRLSRFEEVALSDLIVAQLDEAGRPLVLTKSAANAWLAMRGAAEKDGISLHPFSGFRSYLYQKGLFQAKLARGVLIDEILKSLAAPGYSEHHTGEALDITTVDCPAGEEVFESTSAHAWLAAHAGSFGFTESFPRGNPHNLVYEPWHWKYHSK